MERAFVCLLIVLSLYGSYGAPALKLIEFKGPPQIGATAKVNPMNASQTVRSDPIYMGGFSGIAYDGAENSGRGYLFKVITSRGPIADVVDADTGHLRPFALPAFSPEIVEFLVDFDESSATVYNSIGLTKGNGESISGLPNIQAGDADMAYTDDIAIDLFGNVNPNDPLGADFGALVINMNDDMYWMADSYRASLYRFDKEGKLLNRYIPEGQKTSGGRYGLPYLPAEYAQRRNDRGFKALAQQGDILYAFLESPLDNPNSASNNVSKNSSNIRILAFDAVKEKVVAQYVYVLSEGVKLEGDSKVDRIGDVASLGNGRFLVVEQDSRSGKDAFKMIYEIDINGASNINDPKVISVLPANKTIEEITLDKTLPIYPVGKRVVVSLSAVGFDYAGVEGLAVFNSTSVVVVNNNGYQVVPSPFNRNGTVGFDRSRSTWFGLVTGLNFTSSYVTTSTTFNPTTGAATTGTSTSSTTGGVSTSTTSTTSRNTTSTSTTNSAGSIALDIAALVVCLLAFALI